MNKKLNLDKELSYYKHLSIPSGELRISIVAGCDMRCWYCHNEGQGDFTSQKLTVKEIREIVELGLRFGISKVRLTGGEPLIHKEIYEILHILKFEYKIRNVGVNTNGTKLSQGNIQKLVDLEVDSIVVGIDFFDAKISKDSHVGKSSQQIRNNVLNAKKAGLNVQIATVYANSDLDNILKMADWCLENKVLLKILEVSDSTIVKEIDKDFINLISTVENTFNLRLGKTIALNEVYGLHSNGTKILFFHSHCKVRECLECSRMHMRITSKGKAKPCILRSDTEFDILGKEGYDGMLKAIHNLGNPPENKAI
jgi:cyclic pyranopterin phosphate synthase